MEWYGVMPAVRRLTVKIALHMLASDALDGQILIKIDNPTALSYINKTGGVRFEKFSKFITWDLAMCWE